MLQTNILSLYFDVTLDNTGKIDMWQSKAPSPIDIESILDACGICPSPVWGKTIEVAAFLDILADNPWLTGCQPGLSWDALAKAHQEWVAQYQAEYLGGGGATLLPIISCPVSLLITPPNPLSPMTLIEGTNVSEENEDHVDDVKLF